VVVVVEQDETRPVDSFGSRLAFKTNGDNDEDDILLDRGTCTRRSETARVTGAFLKKKYQSDDLQVWVFLVLSKNG
jgi:hypothetical protein